MFTSQEIQQFIQILKSGHHIRILSHRNPDADAVGSMVAFAKICEYYKKSFEIFNVDPIPKNLEFLINDFDYQVIAPEKIDMIQHEQTDVVVFLDCGQINRAGNFGEFLLPHQQTINIDHHMSNPFFADFNKVEDISSTCELLYNLILALEIPIDQKLATALYTGILTDTGMFQYDKTTVNTHKVVAELLGFGVDHFRIYQQIYQNNPISFLTFLAEGLSKLELYENNTVALLDITQDELINYKFDDIHVLFPIIMSAQDIEVCVILKEKEDKTISASLRSKNNINVAEIAQVFHGGGHIRAAGCRSSEYSLNDFKLLIYKEIKKHL